MKRALTTGLILISILMAFSLGTVFAEVSKDKVNTISTKNVTNTTENNTTSFNTTNEIMPLNATNATNSFEKERGYTLNHTRVPLFK